MSDSTQLGNRMKAHERVTKFTLPKKTYTIIRVDGKSFHSYLKNAVKPYDYEFMNDMDEVAKVLVKEITGAKFAYVQSDEISLVLTDFDSCNTEPWFGGVVQKMCSVSAALATATLNKLRPEQFGLFDSRVFTLSFRSGVLNYFIWRQRDAVRNSIAMAAQAVYSHKELMFQNSSSMQDLLWEKGVNWNEYPLGAKNGRIAYRNKTLKEVSYIDKRNGEKHTEEVWRTEIVADGAPTFSKHFVYAMLPDMDTAD